MRSLVASNLESGRIRQGEYASDPSYGLTGAFFIKGPQGAPLVIIASDGLGWEHVSVSTRDRCPTWEEMCFVKDLFWSQDECVLQFHPPKTDYINHHPYCLHLWKRPGVNEELPPFILLAALKP